MATKKINISGVQAGRGPNNQTPVRLEINTYLEDNDRKNLLLLGLERMQARPQSDMKSWYQIAGIHGRPYKPWDGEANSSGAKPGGYCTHSSILFLTWHRPYLALYEQVLYEDIQAVVQTFPTGAKRDQLSKVALTFRIPYWDWAAKPQPHPVLLQKEITVEKPNGVVKIPNPLFSFRFQQTNDFPPGKYKNWKQTLRHPLSDNSTQGQDEIFANIKRDLEERALEDRFAGRRGTWINIRERIWHLLNLEQNRYQTYQAFSNNRWYDNGRSSDYDSLESVHDWLHGMIGGGGHMGNPGYAGFDPVFWLHHCNVDRLYALWQALHPEADQKWDFSERAITEHTLHWWVPGAGNRREEENTPLIPFHQTDARYWDSNSVRDLKVFGYTYPELTDWNVPGVTREQLRAKVAAAVKSTYGNRTTAGSLMNTGPSTGPFMTLAAVPTEMSALEEKALGEPMIPAGNEIVHNNSHREYFANIRAPKYSFNGPYVVHVFLGTFTEDYTQRPFDRNLIGSWAVFANDISTTGCENCLKNAEQHLTVTGSIPLTSALLERIAEIGSLDIDRVEPYLKENLHWRIHHNNAEHSNIDRTIAEDLLFTVTSVVVEHPTTPDGLAVYRDWNPLPGVTAGRPTGAGFGDAEGYEG